MFMVLGFELRQALCCKNVFDFTRADAEGQRSECPVCGGMAVATNHGLPRLGDTKLRSHDVHDALVPAVHVEQGDARLLAVPPKRFKLSPCFLVDNRKQAVLCGTEWSITANVNSARWTLWPELQTCEGLRRVPSCTRWRSM